VEGCQRGCEERGARSDEHPRTRKRPYPRAEIRKHYNPDMRTRGLACLLLSLIFCISEALGTLSLDPEKTHWGKISEGNVYATGSVALSEDASEGYLVLICDFASGSVVARWMDPSGGRFVSVDPYAGKVGSPVSLHRYMYANQSPAKFCDPSGEFSSISSISGALAIYATLQAGQYTVAQLRYGSGRRPDDDRRLNWFETSQWWKKGQGKELNINLSTLDLSAISKTDFYENGVLKSTKPFNLAWPEYYSSMNDALIYGNITLTLGSGSTVTASPDKYDFDWHSGTSLKTMVRNVETVGGLILHGPGEPFTINLHGIGRIGE